MTQRYWVTPSNYVDREWTEEEYKTCDPKIGIIVKMPYVKCEKCGHIINQYWDTTFMECLRCGKVNHTPYNIVNLDTKLRCIEFGEKEIDGLITQYTHFYGGEN